MGIRIEISYEAAPSERAVRDAGPMPRPGAPYRETTGSSGLPAGARVGDEETPTGRGRELLNRHREPLAGALGVLGCAAAVGGVFSSGDLPKALLFCAGGGLLIAGWVALRKPKKTNELVLTVLAFASVVVGLYGALNQARSNPLPVAISTGASAQEGCGNAPLTTPPTPPHLSELGQINGGTPIFQIQVAHDKYSNIVLAPSPSVLTLDVRLYDPGPDAVGPLLVSVPLGSRATDCWYVTVRTYSETADPLTTMVTVVVNVAGSRPSTLTYVPGSTSLWGPNRRGLGIHRIGPLPDGLTEGGIYVSNAPDEVFLPGPTHLRLVVFKLRLTPVS